MTDRKPSTRNGEPIYRHLLAYDNNTGAETEYTAPVYYPAAGESINDVAADLGVTCLTRRQAVEAEESGRVVAVIDGVFCVRSEVK
ncbi:MAG: hypothetical protein R3258_10595 [Acidimicrobiia bacterium]|nr:hypothetical protein [Acidimicrobiia bacterium]